MLPILLPFLFLVSAHAVCDVNLISELGFKINGASARFPCDSTKNIYITSGRYVQKSLIITRIVIYKDTAIVCLPRYKAGVPFTLGAFSLKGNGRPNLVPYPSWALQEEGNCDALQSCVDIALDQLDCVWVLDVGVVNTLEQPVRRCPAKLVGINARTGQVIKIIDISKFVTSDSRLQYLVVENDKTGNPFAYISDAGAGAIIVYDIFGNKGYRVVLPAAVSQGLQFKDVLYIALIRKTSGNYLYFTYLSSPRLFYIKTDYLQQGRATGAVVDVGPKPQGNLIVLLGTDNADTLFFRYKGDSDIYIWNTESCFKLDNFLLVQKGDDCRLATQVVPGYKKLMWVLESNFQDYVSNSVGCLGASVVVHPLVKVCE